MLIDPHQSLWTHLMRSLAEAAAFNQNTHVAPAAVLWPDGERLWESLVPTLRQRLPHFVTLGDYLPDERQGPAIYLRCLIGRTLQAASWPAGIIPIIYLPGVASADLKAIESCPDHLAPIAELVYRGAVWRHHNQREWSPVAWCCSGKWGGLGLNVKEDRETARALSRSLPDLIDRPLREFQGKLLNAGAIEHLVVPDMVRMILRWLSDAGQAKEDSLDSAQWQAFAATVKRDYGCDPINDGALVAAEMLVKRQGNWALVWDRFAENPHSYRRLATVLRQATAGIFTLGEDSQSLPIHNDQQEEALRAALVAVGEQSRAEAAKRVLVLEAQHACRRQWVWAALDEAPLAQALEHLVTLARGVQHDLGGETLADMAQNYAAEAWRIDAAAWQAYRSVASTDDRAAITAALKALYAPWLDAAATQAQHLMCAQTAPAKQQTTPEISPGEVWIFADGLRFDLGMTLAGLLADRGLKARMEPRWVALPSVTATAKYVASPIPEAFTGAPPGTGFQALMAGTGKEATADRFRSALKAAQIANLAPGETGDPAGMAWTEAGQVDELGHQQQAALPRFIPEQVAALADRIIELLGAGWQRIRVVTDHGWLWLPSGLPKRVLPKHCTLPDSHWTRCAVLDENVQPGVPVVPWHWHDAVAIAVAPGAGSFIENVHYSHGGISMQECLAPMLLIEREASASLAKLAEWKWRGLTCKVTTSGAQGGERVDLRSKANDPGSSLLASGAGLGVLEQGQATIYADDSYEGSSAFLVLLDASGVLLDKRTTEIGG